MRGVFALAIASSKWASIAYADCTPMMEFQVKPEFDGLKFFGFEPTVTRISGSEMGNKIVLKNYAFLPEVVYEGSKVLVSAGESCVEESLDPVTSVDSQSLDASEESDEGASAAVIIGGLAVSLFSGNLAATALAMAAVSSSVVYAGDEPRLERKLSCSESIEVEIYTDVDELIAMDFKSGPKFDACGPESFYYEHNEHVYDGYKGCVSEKYLIPGDQDGQGATDDAMYAKMPLNYVDGKLVETGYNVSTRVYWILWGDPLDKYELVRRTGLNPTVKFPLIRGPYPAYQHGTFSTSPMGDDAASAKAMAFDVLVYIKAFEESERSEWTVSMTEGAESGVVALWGAMALKIARTTCNRDIFVLTETPSYGYSNSDAASLANKQASSFYEGRECLCYAEGTCKVGNVKVISKGWLPSTPLPEGLGGDNITYTADSASPSSPWFESMVFPENPTGRIKTPQMADPGRRVCDGVYVWPMYFGMKDYKIPIDERPDCSSWSFSITKAYSASVRAGYIMYKTEPESDKKAYTDSISQLYSMTNGLFSQWTWQGQMQLWEMVMSKPLEDPTSWLGAYSEIMDEKWKLMEDAFANCPVLELTNPKAGAYAFFVYKPEYTGIQDSFVTSFFMDVLGIKTTTYYWGFRGANPADYYGKEYGVYDFTRLQLYRDVGIYEEVARRAKIVCADTSASVGDFISTDDWAAKGSVRSRRLNESGDLHNADVHRNLLKDTLPHLSDRQLDLLVENEQMSHQTHVAAESCAPEYTTTCFFEKIGTQFEDADIE